MVCWIEKDHEGEGISKKLFTFGNCSLNSFLFQIGLSVLSIVVVIGSLSIWFIIPTIILFGIFYGLRNISLKSSRDIKRIESISKFLFNSVYILSNLLVESSMCSNFYFSSQSNIYTTDSILARFNHNQGIQSAESVGKRIRPLSEFKHCRVFLVSRH